MAIILDAYGVPIRVQKMKQHKPQVFTILGWNVGDIEAAVTRLANAGVLCEKYGFPQQDERGTMTFPGGTRVAWFKDPDGNVLSVAQIAP